MMLCLRENEFVFRLIVWLMMIFDDGEFKLFVFLWIVVFVKNVVVVS